ncbi:hypothetical protein RUM44_011582 [Polyplax serrata]|uniref:Uncharacterized protein n=1 Tax=Polyplax serrata TaxID=468196 RepID=A0ABR1AQF7_POLSC
MELCQTGIRLLKNERNAKERSTGRMDLHYPFGKRKKKETEKSAQDAPCDKTTEWQLERKPKKKNQNQYASS